ncbi:MAG TPA: alpha/beta fold hydrolase [Terriglobales bacterium]
MKLYVLIALAVLVPVPSATASDAHTVNVNGVRRQYLLHVPANVGSAPAPLVIALHGGGGNGKSMERYSRFDAVADREKFVVAYPDGLDRGWNDGRGEIRHSADDVAFIAALIDDISGLMKVDSKRVYVTGISNGGMMSNRVACELSDRVAAVALVASSAGSDAMKTCRARHPIGYLLIAGTTDPIVPYSGGTVRILRGRSRGEVIGAEPTIRFWAKANACAGAPTLRSLADQDNDGTSVIISEYNGCAMPTVLYRIEGGGHTWPSSRPYLPKSIIGNTSTQIDATEVIWKFFSKVHH